MLVTPGIEGLDGQNVSFSYKCKSVLEIVFAAWGSLYTKSRFQLAFQDEVIICPSLVPSSLVFNFCGCNRQ